MIRERVARAVQDAEHYVEATRSIGVDVADDEDFYVELIARLQERLDRVRGRDHGVFG